MLRIRIVLLALVVVATACSSGPMGTSGAAPEATDLVTRPSAGAPSPGDAASSSAGPAEPDVDLDEVVLRYEVVAEGFEAPVVALPRPGGPDLWVAEQAGRIWSVAPGRERALVVDLTDRVAFGGERGLLGLAFAPDHADSGDFVLHYSSADRAGDTRVERWRATDAGAAPGGVVLEVDQPAGNHNGGMIQFGPGGMLWIALGDGGGSNDRFGNGQRPDTLLGAILRLDLSQEPYAIPADNPFVDGVTGDGDPAAPEVWAYGLRNPWRFWIEGGLLYVGDVGQGEIEEVDVLGLDQGGANLGWPIREGTRCFQAADCRSDGLVLPVAEYDHSAGACSVTGGVVNVGPAVPELDGHWFYADFCAGFLRSFRVGPDGAATDARDWTEQVGAPTQVLSFGRDQEGNVLVLGADGTIRRIVAA